MNFMILPVMDKLHVRNHGSLRSLSPNAQSTLATQLSRRCGAAYFFCHRNSKQKALAGGRTPEDLRIQGKDLIGGTRPASAAPLPKLLYIYICTFVTSY